MGRRFMQEKEASWIPRAARQRVGGKKRTERSGRREADGEKRTERRGAEAEAGYFLTKPQSLPSEALRAPGEDLASE